MIRRLFAVAAVLSLLLFVATIALWVRSYWVMDYGGHYRDHWDAAGLHATAYGAYSKPGGIGLYWFRRLAPPALVDEPFHLVNPEASGWNYQADEPLGDYPAPAEVPGWHLAGFGFHHGDHTPPTPRVIANDIYVLFPDWLVIAASAAIFSLWCRRTIVRRRRANQGRCLSCGYDLRASKGRCPECGTPIPAEAKA